MVTLFTEVRRTLIELNLFKSGLNEGDVVRQERWSTRLYITLMMISLLVLVIYVALGIRTVHVTVHEPSSELFETLQLKYSETLKCPCSQIAVKYDRFIQVQPTYHQVGYFK